MVDLTASTSSSIFEPEENFTYIRILRDPINNRYTCSVGDMIIDITGVIGSLGITNLADAFDVISNMDIRLKLEEIYVYPKYVGKNNIKITLTWNVNVPPISDDFVAQTAFSFEFDIKTRDCFRYEFIQT